MATRCRNFTIEIDFYKVRTCCESSQNALETIATTSKGHIRVRLIYDATSTNEMPCTACMVESCLLKTLHYQEIPTQMQVH